MRSVLRILLPALAVLALLGTGAALWHTRARDVVYFTDADTIRRPEEGTRPRDVLWIEPVDPGPVINTPDDDYEPQLAPDGLTLLFVRGKAGENADIVASTRSPAGWSDPVPLDDVNTEADELGPELSADGTTLYFYSNRAGGAGGYDVWVATRRGDAWQPAQNLGEAVNSAYNEYGPAVTPDGATLYFASNRPRTDVAADPVAKSWSATVREDLYEHDYDIYASAITDRGAGVAARIDMLNSTANDGAPAVSPVGDFVYFTSDRPGGAGGFDLYRARRVDGGFLAPESLGPSVNTAANELDPALSLDGFGLHFSSDRNGVVEPPTGDPPARADYDVFYATSREVYRDVDTVRASIDWLALLPLLLWLIAVLLTLLLAYALWRLMRSERFGRLGLLARCLLTSALLHMLLLFLLTFWGVGSSLSDWMKRGTGTRVAIVSPSIGEGIVAQLRGDVTDFAVEPTVDAVARQQETVSPTPVALAPAVLAVARSDIEAQPLPTPDDPSRDAAMPAVTEPPIATDAVAEPVELALDVPAPATPASAAEAAVDVRVEVAPSAAQQAVAEAAPDEVTTVRLPPAAVDAAAASARLARVPAELADASRWDAAAPETPPVAPSAPDPHAQVDLPAMPEARAARAVEADAPVRPQPERVARVDLDAVVELAGSTVPAPQAEAVEVTPEAAAATPATTLVRLDETAAGDGFLPPAAPAPLSAVPPAPDRTAGPEIAAMPVARASAAPEKTARVPAGRAVAPAERREDLPASAIAGEPTMLVETAPPPASAAADTARLARPTPPRDATTLVPAPAIARDSMAALEVDAARPLALPAMPSTAAPSPVAETTPARIDARVTRAARADTAAAALPAATDGAIVETAAPAAMPAPPAPRLAVPTPARDAPLPVSGGAALARLPAVNVPAARAVDLPAIPATGTNGPVAEAELMPIEASMEHLARTTALPVGARAAGSDRAIVETAAPSSSPVPAVERLARPIATRDATLPVSTSPAFASMPAIAIDAARPVELPAMPAAGDATAAAESTADRFHLDVAPSRRVTPTPAAPGPRSAPGTVETTPLPAGPMPVIDRLAILTSARDVSAPIDAFAITAMPTVTVAPAPPIDVRLPADAGVARARDDEAAAAVLAPGRAPRGARSERAPLARTTPAPAPAWLEADPMRRPAAATPDASLLGARPAMLDVRPLEVEAPRFDLARLAPAGLLDLDIRMPETPDPPLNPQWQRAKDTRMELVEQLGGSAETEAAVALALEWLARHQSDDGRWDSGRYDRACGECPGHTRIDVDIAITALSLLCYFASDHTHVREGPFHDTVTRGLSWLVAQQTDSGSLMANESMYSHGIATIVLAEAYGMTGDPALRRPVEDAVRFILRASSRREGGWRYAPGQAGDTSVLGWQIMALKSARTAGIEVPEAGFDVGRRWLDKVASVRRPGLFSYQPGRSPSAAMTAEGMFAAQLLDVAQDEPGMQAAAQYLLDHPPVWDEDPNTYYWYYATLALFQHQDDAWRQWNEMMKDVLLGAQHQTGGAAGSWDPVDQWARTGGRVYQTAICTLTLEVYYRYLLQFVEKGD